MKLHVGDANRAQRALHIRRIGVRDQQRATFFVSPVKKFRYLLRPSDAETLFEAVHCLTEGLIPAQDRQKLRFAASALFGGEREVFLLRVLREEQLLRGAGLRRTSRRGV